MLTSVLDTHRTEIPHKHLQKYLTPFLGCVPLTLLLLLLTNSILLLLPFFPLIITFSLTAGPSTLRDGNCLFAPCFVQQVANY